MTRREQVIWAAGFIDGEGCIAIAKSICGGRDRGRVETVYVRLSVGQRVPEPLYVLQGLFGGSVSQEKRGMYKWVLTWRTAGAALAELVEFLVVKRDQAELALAFQGRRGTAGNRQRTVAQDDADFVRMKELKRPWNAIPDLQVELKARK